MPNSANLRLGPCQVTFNGVDLGHTVGPVDMTYEVEHADVNADKYGKSPVDSYLLSEKLTVKVPLAEITIPNLKVAIPHATFGGAGNARITIGQVAGRKASDVAAQLVLHPLNNGTRADDIVLHKAFVKTSVVLSHAVDSQKVIEVTFESLIDETKSQGNYLGLIGDSAA